MYNNVGGIYHQVVKKSLKSTAKELETCRLKLDDSRKEILSKLNETEQLELDELLDRERNKRLQQIKATHNKKLTSMWLNQRPRGPDCVLNLSNKFLSLEEKNVLYRGLNFHILPAKINELQIKADVEKFYKLAFEQMELSTCDDSKPISRYEIVNELRGLTRNFIRSSKHVVSKKQNVAFHKTLDNLRKDESIAVVKYDKGNGICIMERNDYLEKLDTIVNDGSKFKRVELGTRKNAKHPIVKRQEKIRAMVGEHVQKYVGEETAKWLKPSGTVMGKLYGTCKVHKEGYPVRPIVSMVNTPEYNLAKYLDSIIKPLIPAKYAVTSNVDFLNQLKSYDQEGGDFCVSFDVVSLFTNIPLEFTIELIADKLYGENNVTKPPMPKSSLVELLRCATGGMFSHRNELLQQTDGVSMGNPLAPTLANFFLGSLENELWETELQHAYPVFYTRYVDDVFCIFREGADFKVFLSKLNSLHRNLSFTYELGGSSLPFLDMRVDLQATTISSTIYRKKTDTGVILNYSSNAPRQWKSALFKWFLARAERLCSDESLRQEEWTHLRNQFHANGYPDWFLDKELDKYKQHKVDTATSEMDVDQRKDGDGGSVKERRIWCKIPFVGRPSLQFRKRVMSLFKGVLSDPKVVFTTSKVKDYFVNKDTTPKPFLSQVVYQFTCLRDADTKYVGFTNRKLKQRVHEHLRTGTTAIGDHLTKCDVCCNNASMDDFVILKKCQNATDARIFEALMIKKTKPKLNINLIKPGATWTLKVFY